MPHPYLMFCPYLDINRPLDFGGWRVGPLESFDGTWGEKRFESLAKAFLQKFTDAHGRPLPSPTLIGRGGTLDGELPAPSEIDALQAALHFGFLDHNPAFPESVDAQGWQLITSDNTELFVWPIDVEAGHVTVTTGGLLRTLNGGLEVDDAELEIRSPLELHMRGASSADVDLLTAVYAVCLEALQKPGAPETLRRVQTAIHWFAKAWKNSTSIDMADRIVFLKTGFEALMGPGNSRETAAHLRQLFESLPDTDDSDSETLLWSPLEKPIRFHTYKKKTEYVTDLEHWFLAFADARNAVIHEGLVPSLNYTEPGSRYEGPFFHSGEFVLRAAIKSSLAAGGHPDMWRASSFRAVKAAWDAAQSDSGDTSA